MTPEPATRRTETQWERAQTPEPRETPTHDQRDAQNDTQPCEAVPVKLSSTHVEQKPLTFQVIGSPASQGSKRHVGGGRMVEMDKKLPAWRAKVIEAGMREAAGRTLDGALSVRLEVFMPRPKSSKFGEHPAGPPDLDKLQRAVGDALTQAKVIADDARIVHWDARKLWAVNGVCGAVVAVTEIG